VRFAARPLCGTLLLLFTAWVTPAQAASASEDPFAVRERAGYSALCHKHRDLDSCSDAVRWNPGDPALIVALADALARAGRLPESLRDYRRAEALAPDTRGLEAKIKSTEAKLSERHAPKKPAIDHASVDAAAGKRYSNADPEAQSH
jgi:hypothetical protein